VNAPHFAYRHGGYAQLHLSAWCSAAPITSAADSLPGRYVQVHYVHCNILTRSKRPL
jgi:hypothetical protein